MKIKNDGYWYNESLKKRYAFQAHIKRLGKLAVFCIGAFLMFILGTIGYQAYPAFFKSYVAVDVVLTTDESPRTIIRNYLYEQLQPETRKQKKMARTMLAEDAEWRLEKFIKDHPHHDNAQVRVWLPASDGIDQYIKGKITKKTPETRRIVKDIQMQWVYDLQLTEQIEVRFNTDFFTNADSRDPTQAGIFGALIGSLMTLAICLLLSMVFGVLGAVYLEEFAPKNKWTTGLEAVINNLAAVPSIVFGLLGLAVLLNLFGMPRSAAITGGVVLAMMSLPTIIIASRNALKGVPDALRQAGLGLGATRTQVVLHHVLPSAAPTIITGSIIAMAQALGETAPLLMIGMVAFVADIPSSINGPVSTLPVQIFLWSDLPEAAFVEKASAAILVLLAVVFTMIAMAGYLRHKFENRNT